MLKQRDFLTPPRKMTSQGDREWYMGEIFRMRCQKCGRPPRVVLTYEANYWDNEITLKCCDQAKTFRLVGRNPEKTGRLKG